MDFLSSPSRSPPISSPQSCELGFGINNGNECILHPVSWFDTLAGVAVRYGVEVADIKKLNGLSTDFQMFALNTLQIPLSGSHPPSHSTCSRLDPPSWVIKMWFITRKIGCRRSSCGQSRQLQLQNDLLESLKSASSSSSSETKVSSTASTLRGGYYGHDEAANGSPFSSRHRKSRSVATGLTSASGSLRECLLLSEGGESSSSSSTSSENWFEKLFSKRRQKSDSDFASYYRPPEELMINEEANGGSTVSTITGKGLLALRPKSSSIPTNLG
ncbi:hypothetical protein M569_10725 [Genlisea aurea]|uniref:LysM domain-containing protein n=1 Tax=Genlisea aurea TaxID=192259 RepID=S8CHK8_9LAMI|nr:hypothetical protein M569_10725 [Genlisea aurea]